RSAGPCVCHEPTSTASSATKTRPDRRSYTLARSALAYVALSLVGGRCPHCGRLRSGPCLLVIGTSNQTVYVSGRAASFAEELVEERLRASVDLVDDGPNVVDVLAGRVGEVPVEVALAGEDGACVTTAHGDDHVGGARRFVGERLRKLLGHVQPALREYLGDSGVDVLTRGRAGGADGHPTGAVVVEQDASGHRAAGVVGAHDEDLGTVSHRGAAPIG